MKIKEIENVLTKQECEILIEHSKNQLKKLTTVGSNNNYRVGDGTWIFSPVICENVDINLKIKKLVFEQTSLPIENQEAIHVVNYKIGGEYKEHHDFFHATSEDFNNHVSRGGQRSYSLLFYLNDDFDGGETKFVKDNLIIKPKQGKLLMWTNLNEDGSLDYDSKHAGLPVLSGEKWIAIVWVRQNKFI